MTLFPDERVLIRLRDRKTHQTSHVIEDYRGANWRERFHGFGTGRITFEEGQIGADELRLIASGEAEIDIRRTWTRADGSQGADGFLGLVANFEGAYDARNKFNRDLTALANEIVVLGQGEGAARQVVRVYDEESQRAFGLKERVFDRRDTGSLDELEEFGRGKLGILKAAAVERQSNGQPSRSWRTFTVSLRDPLSYLHDRFIDTTGIEAVDYASGSSRLAGGRALRRALWRELGEPATARRKLGAQLAGARTYAAFEFTAGDSGIGRIGRIGFRGPRRGIPFTGQAQGTMPDAIREFVWQPAGGNSRILIEASLLRENCPAVRVELIKAADGAKADFELTLDQASTTAEVCFFRTPSPPGITTAFTTGLYRVRVYELPYLARDDHADWNPAGADEIPKPTPRWRRLSEVAESICEQAGVGIRAALAADGLEFEAAAIRERSQGSGRVLLSDRIDGPDWDIRPGDRVLDVIWLSPSSPSYEIGPEAHLCLARSVRISPGRATQVTPEVGAERITEGRLFREIGEAAAGAKFA